jgi:hypothetical protein
MRYPHIILGIPPYSDKDEVKQAYHRLAKQYHPDLYEGDKKYAHEKFKEIKIAYEKMYASAPKTKPKIKNDGKLRIYRVVKARWNQRCNFYEITIDINEEVAKEDPVLHVMVEGDCHLLFQIQLPNLHESSVILIKTNDILFRTRFNFLPPGVGLF